MTHILLAGTIRSRHPGTSRWEAATETRPISLLVPDAVLIECSDGSWLLVADLLAEEGDSVRFVVPAANYLRAMVPRACWVGRVG